MDNRLTTILVILFSALLDLTSADGDFAFPSENSVKETSESRHHKRKIHHHQGGYPAYGPYAGGGGCWHVVNPAQGTPHARTFGLFELFGPGHGGGPGLPPPLHDHIQGPAPLPPIYIQCNTLAGGVAPIGHPGLAPVGPPPVGPHPVGGLLANHPLLAQHLLGGGPGGLFGGPGGILGPGGLLGGAPPSLGSPVVQALTNVLTDKKSVNKFLRQINRNFIKPLSRLFR